MPETAKQQNINMRGWFLPNKQLSNQHLVFMHIPFLKTKLMIMPPPQKKKYLYINWVMMFSLYLPRFHILFFCPKELKMGRDFYDRPGAWAFTEISLGAGYRLRWGWGLFIGRKLPLFPNIKEVIFILFV